MMGRGADGGCAENYGSASSSSRISISMENAILKSPDQSDRQGSVGHRRRGVDVFSQVLKALAVKPTHGAEEGGASGSLSLSAGPPSLNFLNSTENKRKHRAKKSDVSGSMHKKHAETNWNRDRSGGHFWLHMEEYFREPTSDDIQLLIPKTNLVVSNISDVSDSALLMPPVGPFYKGIWLEEDAKEAAKDSKMLNQQSVTGVKRKLLAASPLSKKKKFAVSASEVITTVISPPENDDDELCHVCYGGDSNEQNQILFCDSCNVAVHQECYGIRYVPDGQWLCSWCSHRSHSSGDACMIRESSPRGEDPSSLSRQLPECVLCPINGGALKAVAADVDSTSGNIKSAEVRFAHLFCCQWIPETYIRDIEIMEPIMNVEGVREERRKLMCSVCKDKHGACIQCSHGMCATAFHPLCAREAKFQMEVSSKEGSEDIYLRAFCSKHSTQVDRIPVNRHAQTDVGRGSLEAKSFGHALNEDTTSTASGDLGVTSKAECPSSSMIFKEEILLDHLSHGAISAPRSSSTVKEDNDAFSDVKASENLTLGAVSGGSATGGSVNSLSKFKESMDKTSPSCTVSDTRCIVRKIMRQAYTTIADVAVQMGISHDILSTWLQGEESRDEEVQKKIGLWIASDRQAEAHKGRHGDEAAENPQHESHHRITRSNEKKKSFKTYRNKRHKVEQKPPVSSEMHFEKGLSPQNQVLSTLKDVGFDEEKHAARQDIHGSVTQSEIAEVGADIGPSTNTKEVAVEVDALNKIVDGKRKHELEYAQEVETVPSNVGTESDVSFDEERRQRGLSGEASTSQDCSWTTRSSAGQLCNFPPLRKGRQKLLSCTFEVEPQLVQSPELKKESGGKYGSCISLQQRNMPISREEQALHEDTYTAAEDGFSRQDRSTTAGLWKLGSHGTCCSLRPDVLEQAASDSRNLHHLANSVTPPVGNVAVLSEQALATELQDHQQYLQSHGDEASQINIHPFILKRLQEVQQSWAAGDGCQPGLARHRRLPPHTGREKVDLFTSPTSPKEILDASSLSDDLSPSASPSGDDCQILSSKMHQSTGSVHKVNLASKCFGVLTNESQMKQLHQAKDLGVLEMAPGDEVEEEILALQERLILCAHKNYHQCEQLILKVITNLSEDLRASRKKHQDLILVNEYLSEAREAKKQGRKERRNKEAQAVLAAATAAAAASPRLGSLRRDGPGGPLTEDIQFPARDSTGGMGQTSVAITSMPASSYLSGVSTVAHLTKPTVPKPLKVNTAAGRTSSSSRTSLRDKATFARQSDAKVSVTKNRGSQLLPTESREEPATCDICSTQDCSRLNKIIICQRCKVAVHQDCYGASRIPMGAWYCQPCSEIRRQFQGLGLPEVADRGRPGLGVQCALCSGYSGAFKRSTDSRWAHVFCAQWVPETTVGKDQTGLIEGLETIPMERFLQQCSICHGQQGACLRCSFGHCHGAFHPFCARDSGLYMSVKCSPGGRIQYRAYCERHSPQQREKAESRRCGSSDELSALKQIRVELERVRLICERISRRERLKRDLLNHRRNVYAARMAALPFAVMDASNDQSATSNSMDMPVALCKEDSWAIDNRKNDSVAAKPQRLDCESYSWNSGAVELNRYQDSPSGDSVYQNKISRAEPSRQMPAKSQMGSSLADVHGSGRQDPVAEAGAKSEDQKRPKKYRKQAETLHTEVVMTPTEASVQNQRLPKGYAYVPVVLLSKGKVTPSESSAPQDP